MHKLILNIFPNIYVLTGKTVSINKFKSERMFNNMKNKKSQNNHDKRLDASRKEFTRFSNKRHDGKISDYFEFTLSAETLEAMENNPELLSRFKACINELMELFNIDTPLSVEELDKIDIIDDKAMQKALEEYGEIIEDYEEFADICKILIGDKEFSSELLDYIEKINDIIEDYDEDDEDYYDEYEYDDEDDEDETREYQRTPININITFEDTDDSPNHDNYGGFGSAQRQKDWGDFFLSNGGGC